MKRLIDAVAKRLGYVSGGTFDDITETYARRILELGDEIEALKRRITHLTGMLAAADDDREKAVSALLVRLKIEQDKRSCAEKRLADAQRHIRGFRADTEGI